MAKSGFRRSSSNGEPRSEAANSQQEAQEASNGAPRGLQEGPEWPYTHVSTPVRLYTCCCKYMYKMCLHICTYVYICVRVRMSTHVHTCIQYMCVHSRCAHTHTVHVWTYQIHVIHAYVYLRMCTLYTYLPVHLWLPSMYNRCLYTCTYVYIYIYIYKYI